MEKHFRIVGGQIANILSRILTPVWLVLVWLSIHFVRIFDADLGEFLLEVRSSIIQHRRVQLHPDWWLMEAKEDYELRVDKVNNACQLFWVSIRYAINHKMSPRTQKLTRGLKRLAVIILIADLLYLISLVAPGIAKTLSMDLGYGISLGLTSLFHPTTAETWLLTYLMSTVVVNIVGFVIISHTNGSKVGVLVSRYTKLFMVIYLGPFSLVIAAIVLISMIKKNFCPSLAA